MESKPNPHNPNCELPKRVQRLKLPEVGPKDGVSAREADLELLSHAADDFLDTTHFDTVRFPPPASALEHFSRAAADGSQAYSGYRGHPQILNHVADVAGKFLGLDLNAKENVILTPGTQAGLFASLSARIESGSRVAVFDPDYLFTARILSFLDCEVAYVPLVSSDGELGPDLEALEKEFQNGTKHLVFSHPNNPTGAVYSRALLEKIAELVSRYDVKVVVDELYSRLIYDGVTFTHLASLPGMQERVITLLGPSKTESLSGYRIGVVVGPAETMKAVENVLSITALRCPAYAQHCLLGWLNDDQQWLDGLIKDFDNLRKMTLEKLSEIPWLKVEQRDATAYAWVDVSALGLPDDVISQKLLVDANVLVSPGYQFGPSGKGKFRLCFARDEQEWAAALERINQVLLELAETSGSSESQKADGTHA